MRGDRGGVRDDRRGGGSCVIVTHLRPKTDGGAIVTHRPRIDGGGA